MCLELDNVVITRSSQALMTPVKILWVGKSCIHTLMEPNRDNGLTQSSEVCMSGLYGKRI